MPNKAATTLAIKSSVERKTFVRTAISARTSKTMKATTPIAMIARAYSILIRVLGSSRGGGLRKVFWPCVVRLFELRVESLVAFLFLADCIVFLLDIHISIK
jgi:hypothetical protein